MLFIELIETELDFQRHLLSQFSKLKNIKASGKLLMTHKKNGYKEYYIKKPGETRAAYIRKDDMWLVHRLQTKALGEFGAARASQNIRLLQMLQEEYRPCNLNSLQQDIDQIYRFAEENMPVTHCAVRRSFPQSEKPGRRNELIHSTTFGLMVRSKNEAYIAEQLMAAGIEFYYEKALRLTDSDGTRVVLYPDFTIVLPDGRRIFWEHKGLLVSADYLEADAKRTGLYHMNGIYQPCNLIVTCDGPDGGFPGVEIGMIIKQLLKPAAVGRL